MDEKLYTRTSEGALQAALNHRPFFDIIGRHACLFLANGNHGRRAGLAAERYAG